jgi:hypothetical protein
MKDAAIYGLTVFGAVAFIGAITGMGGSLVPNLGFSALMGVFAAGLYLLARRYARSKD